MTADVIEVSTPALESFVRKHFVLLLVLLRLLAQETFAQKKPHFVCQCRGKKWELGERAGFEVKCRNPRCSKACLRNWTHKQAAILDYFLHYMLPPSNTVFRGNLILNDNAKPADHIKVRDRFQRALKRRCGGKVAFRAMMHFTSVRDAHYDIVAYAPSDLPPVRVERAVKESWEVAGGKRATCRPLDSGDELDDEQRAIADYTFKARPRDDRFRFVPLKLEDGGIKITFGTTGFWGKGWSEDKVWAARNEALFPKRYKAVFVADQWSEISDPSPSPSEARPDPAPITIGNNTSPAPPGSTPSDPPSAESAWAVLAGDRQEVEYTINSPFQARLDAFQAAHPDRVLIVPVKGSYTAPAPDSVLRSDIPTALRGCPDGLPKAELAERIGWPLDQVERALNDLPNVVRAGTVVTPAGHLLREVVRLAPVSVQAVHPAREPDSGGTLTPSEQAELEAWLEAG